MIFIKYHVYVKNKYAINIVSPKEYANKTDLTVNSDGSGVIALII